MPKEDAMTIRRFFGIDIHKWHATVASVDAQQQVIFSPQKIAVSKFEAWPILNLTPKDQVAMEGTSNAWAIHDQLLPVVADVSVANCHKYG